MRLFEDTYQGNTHRKAIDLLLSALYMITTRRLPEEITDKLDPRTFKIDNVFNKINLVNVPEAVVLRDCVATKKVTAVAGGPTTEEKVKLTANLNEMAFCRIRIPHRDQTPSEYATDNPPKTADIGEIDPEKAEDEVELPAKLDADEVIAELK